MTDFDKKTYMKQMSKELHRPVVKRFKRAQVITRGIDDVWAMDLADMNEFKDENDDIRYILTVIDCFSRYAWAVPVENKTGATVLNALKEIIQESNRKPKRLWTDAGKEFVNKKMEKWLEENNITLYHTYGEHKASMVERFNRTLKTNMWKKLTEEQSHRWIDTLPDLLETYNNTKHSAIKMTPTKASDKKNESKLWTFLYGESAENDEKTAPESKFKLNDWVRISKVRNVFTKGYKAGWSHELFKIYEISYTDPVTYKLQDANGEKIKGSFYGQELQKTALGDVFLVDKVIKKGPKQSLVKWTGYSDKFNSMVDNSEIYDLK